jgi:hypothetical protein
VRCTSFSVLGALDNEAMKTPCRRVVAMLALGAAACAPALDWREFVPEGSGIGVAFPCRPDRHERAVTLAGRRAPMQMLVCSAAEMTFALSFVDIADPAGVAPALVDLRETAVRNVQGVAGAPLALQIAGMTPNVAAGRIVVVGRLPDGAAVQSHAAFFVRGLRVYQAMVIGAKPAAPAVDAFISGLKFPP